MARSAGKLPMLATSIGEDRLGGAKIGYIDTGVLLKVVDSAKDLYKVQLSSFHSVYIGKNDVKRDTAVRVGGYHLVSSYSVKGDETFDYVNISLDEKLPYRSWTEINPSKIYIEIYGAQSNTNWITQLRSVKEIKNIDFNQIEDDVVRLTVELKHKQHWGYTVGYKNKILSLRVRRQPKDLRLSNITIAVDAGHGGSNTGTVGISGKTQEKNYTLRYANELENLLVSKGATVVMTRTNDTSIGNIDRVLMLQSVMPDLLVSLHFNSSANSSINGVSTYYKHIGFRPLTTAILHRMLQLPLNEFGNIGNFNFTLNAPTDFPSSLLEIAFLSNKEDEAKVMDPKFQKEVAKKVYKGIKDWLKSAKD